MPEENLDDLETGGGLRNKLESTLQENRAMAQQLSELKAKDVIREQGFGLVKVDDLKGLKADEIEAKALALQEERAALQRDLVKDAFSKQGISGDDLDKRVEEFLAGKPAETTSTVSTEVDAIRDLGRVDGTQVSQTPPSQLHGADAIEAALS